MGKRDVDNHLQKFSRKVQTIKEQVDSLEHQFDSRIKQIRKSIAALDAFEDQLSYSVEAYKLSVEREAKRPIRELEQKLAKLSSSAQLPKDSVFLQNELEGLKQAKTIAIFDAIIFAISNWADDGDTAPDIELACQAILFPAVYERVMSGNVDYVIEKVPTSAMEIVKRGREFVRYIRQRTSNSLTSQAVWDEYACEVQMWWINDALPLIYGARDPKWEDDTPLSLIEITEWRDQPASRALHFPLIFDGMELIEKYREVIRESTGLPGFNRSTIDTRLPQLDERHQRSGNLGR